MSLLELLNRYMTLLGLAAGVTVIVAMYYRYERRRKAFAKVFGFEPPLASDGPEGIQLAQPDVDAILVEKAEALDTAMSNKCLAGEPKGPCRPHVVKQRLKHLREMRQILERTEKDFQRACKLAKAFGLQVHSRYDIYLLKGT